MKSNNLILIKPDSDFYEQMNVVQNSIIIDLQNKNRLLEEKIKHLEDLLLSTEGLLIDFPSRLPDSIR